jgi:hypothetical protein
MRLKSFGCSFIYGTDLSDDGRGFLYATPSKLTWPSLVAQHLGYEYDCYAQPGAGNLRILERVLSQAACNEHNLYVIGWTWIDRFDYIGEARGWNPLGWQTIMPVAESKNSEFYYRNLHSQFTDKLKTLTYMRLAIDTLKQKGCEFIMTCQDELIFETEWHTTPAVTDLQEYIKPYITRFDGQPFLDWSRTNNYAISDMHHPLEPAHRAGADLVISQLSTCIKC